MTNGEKFIHDNLTSIPYFVDKKVLLNMEFDAEWWNAEYKEPTTKNDLGVDCISREAVDRIINKWLSHPDYELKDHIYSMTEKIHNLPSVTPQLSSGLDKKLEKNFGELDCVSREKVWYMITNGKYPNEDYEQFIDRLVNELAELPSVTPQEPRCKDCKWWKDSDGQYRRGCRAESHCPINRKEVYEGNGYCYIYEPQKSEDKE